MEITIHVCDEIKKLKKDFTCPRDLLLDEMKYFQNYLSSETDKWDEIDISVHCDIKIFDWLIQYVKRVDKISEPTLDIHNAVSILISSDFLKMEKLVSKCIDFCCDQLSAIIATPCNMNCINDHLVTRIAAKYDQHGLEKVKDKKDKFKSKLFSKLLQRLFEEQFSDKYSPNNASQLFRCLFCEKLLLPSIQHRIECTNSRMILDERGNISANHAIDPHWDINEFLITTKKLFKNWRGVYWRVWSIINFFECRVCRCLFPVCDFKSCLYHPRAPVNSVDNQTEIRVYPCCNQRFVLFETIKTPSGCKFQDHKVECSTNDNICTSSIKNIQISNSLDVYNEMLTVFDLICISKTPTVPIQMYFDLKNLVQNNQNVTTRKEQTVSAKEVSEKKDCGKSPMRRSVSSTRKKHGALPKNHRSKFDEGEEDQENVSEQDIFRVVINHRDIATSKNRNKSWNVNLPSRLNQDMQREDDLKRMNDLLKGFRQNRLQHGECNKMITYDGGLFHRLETKLKAEILSPQVAGCLSNTNTSNTSRRSKNQ